MQEKLDKSNIFVLFFYNFFRMYPFSVYFGKKISWSISVYVVYELFFRPYK